MASRPQLLDTSAAAGQRSRKLEELAKAHLHLHLPAALRRSSFEEAVRRHLSPGSSLQQSILQELASREEEDAKKHKVEKVKQHQRRRAWVEGGCIYPQCLDPSDLRVFDQQCPQKDLVWDIQFVTKNLLESIPELGASEALLSETVLQLAQDAAKEGILHAELMTGFTPFRPEEEDAGAEAAQKWAALFKARLQALASEGESVSLMFVMVLPNACKSAEHATRILHLLRGVEGFDPAAMAGVGYFAGEEKIREYREAFAAFREAGFRLVCIHAGEGEPSRGEGPARIRDALEIGAERIGHGIEAAAEESLMKELREKRVCLEVCPLSNRALECCPAKLSQVPRIEADEAAGEGLAQHPLPRLLAAGVECALSSDDPLYWAGQGDGAHGLLREYEACRHLMGLDDAMLARLADASLVHSSAPPAVIERGRARVQEWVLSGSSASA